MVTHTRVRRGADQDLRPFGSCTHACGKVHRLAENCVIQAIRRAHVAGDNNRGVNADARIDPGQAALLPLPVQIIERLAHFQRRAQSAVGVVRVRDGRAE